MQKLTIYTGPNCPACIQAKRWLSQAGVAYQEVDITQRRDLVQWLAQTTGQRTIPQFFLGNQWISGGFPAVAAMVQSGQLR